MAKFVKITARDEDGEFSYTGQLIKESKDGALIRTGIAEMFFPKGDYDMSNARKPRNFNATVETAAEVVAEAKTKQPRKTAKASKAKRVTKIDTAVNLIVAFKKDNAEASRQELIHHLMDNIDGMNDKVRASSLYQAAIKRV